MDNLLKDIGKPYEMFFPDGNYQGCFYPVYKLYPYLPKYPLNAKDPSESWEYGISLLEKHCEQIKLEDVKAGDLLVCKYKNELHVAVFIETNKVIHVFRDHHLQIDRLKFFGKRPLMFYRVK